MSVKNKLYAGFGGICIMIVILGVMGWISLNTASKGFKEYREMAKDGVLMGRVQASMLMVRMNAKDYFITGSQKDIEEFNSYYKEVEEFIQIAQKEINNPKRAKIVDEIDQKLDDYKDGFDKIQKFMFQRNDLVNNKINVIGKKSEQLFTELMKSAHDEKDELVAYEAGLALRSLLLGTVYTQRYLKTNETEDANRVLLEFENLRGDMSKLKADITHPQKLQLLTQIIENVKVYEDTFNSLVDVITKRNEIINGTMNKIGPRIANLTEDIKLELKGVQDTIGPRVQDSNELFVVLILSLTILIILIALSLAYFIPKGILSSLNKVSIGLGSFFDFLNRKNKTVNSISLNSNDEFGKMSNMIDENISSIESSIRQDEKLINEVKNVVAHIEEGDVSYSVNATTVNQSLNELKTIFNNMLNTLRTKVATDLREVTSILEECSKKEFTKKINDNGEFAVRINNLIDIINQMLVENMKNGITLDESSDVLLSNVDTLNENSTQAAAALEQTAAALEEVTSNVSNTTQSVIQMANYAKEVVESTKEGEKLANQTTKAMDEINIEVTSISEAISVIDQIAFQTNILSLNAAVEAATAGEAGKGFAVVAQEVRNLAARSAEAAKEIKDLVEKATLKANSGKTIADDMISGYTRLNTSINSTIELIEIVETASKEQQIGVVQINDAINSLDKQTQENANIAAQTKEVAIKTDEISKTVVDNATKSSFIGKDELLKNRTQKEKKVVNYNTKPIVEKKPNETKKSNEVKNKIIESKVKDDDEWESF